MNEKLFIGINEYETLTYRTPKSYNIDMDKINSVADLVLFIKAMYANCYFKIDEYNPYYEDLKHLAKDEID